MEIFAFLLGLGCLVAIAWGISLLSHAVFVGFVTDQTDLPNNHRPSR
jgi:hypothetical protein